MKHRMILLLAIVAAFAFAHPISAAACVYNHSNPYNHSSPSPYNHSNPYSDAWQPVDDSIFLVELSAAGSDASLHIYDFGAPENDLLVLNNGTFANTSIYFSSTDNADGSFSWYADTTPNGQTLALGSSPVFGFYFSQGDTSIWPEYELTSTSGDAYRLYEINTGMQVIVNAAQPAHAPIPAAALLLGSGLIGLVTLRRKS